MNGGSLSRFPRLLTVAAAGLAVSLLAGRSINQSPSTTQNQPVPSTTRPTAPETQPASTQPAPEYPAEAASEERFLSGLIGSKHDFTHGGRRGRDLCLPCHTPHLVAPVTPRLDRRESSTLPLRPFRGAGIELTGWSLLCLGCHDGVTAPDVYTSAHAVSVGGELTGTRIGSRGVRSHPMGVLYPTNDEHYNPLAAVEAAGLMLADGRIQCTTCHDVHNTSRHAKLLRLSDERSRLCLTCHRI